MSKSIKSKSVRNQGSIRFRDSKKEAENKMNDSALNGTSYGIESESTERKNMKEPKYIDNNKRTVFEEKDGDNGSSWQFISMLAAMGIAILFMILKIIGIV